MTEKRFTKCDTKIRDNGEEMTQAEVRDMLNKLHDENEQLRKDATTLIYANQDYRHENEQLREQLEDANELNKIYVDFMVDNGFELSDVVEWSKKDI